MDSTSSPSVSDLVIRARSFRKELLEAGARTEADRRVSVNTMTRLADAGLTDLSRSALYGGFSYGPSVLVHIGYELGQGCGSTAWCAMLANCNSWFASYWSKQAQDDVWLEEPGNLLAVAVVPTGSCEAVQGGFNVWGRWPFSSNCENSQWAVVSAVLPETNGRPTSTVWLLMPMSELTIDQNSWFVSGMQGTGSKTMYVDKPVFVPAHRLIYFDDIGPRKVPGCAIPGNLPANFSFLFGGAALAAPVLGMAQGALNLFVDAMKVKLQKAMKPGMKMGAEQNPFVQERIGRAQAMIHAAFVSLVATLEQVEETIFAGEMPSVEDSITVRSSIVMSVRLATDATNQVMELAGASSADSNLPLQRFWRDINAASRHLNFDAPRVFSAAGQHMLGLEPAGPK
ncbi:acyl-CoA dehydrogenase family protein [Streptomyces fulvoviolaceus]|uniref:acyl-CoA dehydrogenase family protein n=1 Tax=Streptomyces fulvoviolaceus TaxID=285535 RepID=UPI0009977962|nr:acyl-CoA dehydrogenase family protein [Streptomyces fulvoviolaceus]